MKSKSILDAIKWYEGTEKEMWLRVLLHEIREAADAGKTEVDIPVYKLAKLHMPTLRHEILESAGFGSEVMESNKIPGQKRLIIHW